MRHRNMRCSPSITVVVGELWPWCRWWWLRGCWWLWCPCGTLLLSSDWIELWSCLSIISYTESPWMSRSSYKNQKRRDIHMWWVIYCWLPGNNSVCLSASITINGWCCNYYIYNTAALQRVTHIFIYHGATISHVQVDIFAYEFMSLTAKRYVGKAYSSTKT